MTRTESSSNERAAPQITQLATAIRDKLRSLSRLSLNSLPLPIPFEDNKQLVLTLKPRRLKRGWQIRISKLYTTCPECRKIRKRHSITYKALPEIGEISDWLNQLIQVHVENHQKSAAPVSTDDAAREVIRVQSSEEKNSTRIKVLSPATESVPQVGLSQPSQRPRIKINDPSVNGTAPSPVKVSRTQQTRPNSESILSAPCIPYQLSCGDSIEVTIPVSVCDSLIEHCRSSLEHGREVGGVFIGVTTENATTSGVEIGVTVTNLIPFRPADSSGDRLRLTSDSWAHVSQVESDRGYETERKVRLGWYHTHPTQGIFFSRYDKDFHTVFSKPFQFGIVVDPRIMEAGLFYWDDQEHGSAHRLLVGLSTFSLKRVRETDSEPTRVAVAPPPEPVARKIAVQRVIILVVFLLIVFGNAILDNSLTFGPDQVTFGAAVILLVLTLWNAHWFQPEDALERRALTQLEQFIDRLRPSPHPPAPQTKRSLGPVWLIVIAFLIVLGFIVGGSIGTKFTSLRSWRKRAPPASPVSAAGNSFPKPETTQAQQPITIFVKKSGQHVTLEYRKEPNVKELSYDAGSDSKWLCDENAEKDFFRTAFDWDIQEDKPQEYIKPLQVDLGLTKTPDGKWGPRTRTAFVNAALNHNGDSKGIAMNLGNMSPAQVLFKPSAPQD